VREGQAEVRFRHDIIMAACDIRAVRTREVIGFTLAWPAKKRKEHVSIAIEKQMNKRGKDANIARGPATEWIERR